jgi:hypothetical protein
MRHAASAEAATAAGQPIHALVTPSATRMLATYAPVPTNAACPNEIIPP